MWQWFSVFPYRLLRIHKEGARAAKMVTFCRRVSALESFSAMQRSFTTNTSPKLLFQNSVLALGVVGYRQLSDAVSRDGLIHLIDENGKNAGFMQYNEAKLLAEEKNFELILIRPVSHQHSHALFKLVSKKDLFEMKKKKKTQQHNILRSRQKIKELSISTDIGEQDLQWKLDKIKDFLLENDKVKLIINRKRKSRTNCNEFFDMVIARVKEFGETEGNAIETEFRLQCILKPIPRTEKD